MKMETCMIKEEMMSGFLSVSFVSLLLYVGLY